MTYNTTKLLPNYVRLSMYNKKIKTPINVKTTIKILSLMQRTYEANAHTHKKKPSKPMSQSELILQKVCHGFFGFIYKRREKTTKRTNPLKTMMK